MFVMVVLEGAASTVRRSGRSRQAAPSGQVQVHPGKNGVSAGDVHLRFSLPRYTRPATHLNRADGEPSAGFQPPLVAAHVRGREHHASNCLGGP